MAQALQICNGPEGAFGHWASLLRHVLLASMKSVEYCMDVLHYYRLMINSSFRVCCSAVASAPLPLMHVHDRSFDGYHLGVSLCRVAAIWDLHPPVVALKHEGDFDHES
jgi:hypothetical protein